MAHLAGTTFDVTTWPLYLAGAIFLFGVWIGRKRKLGDGAIDSMNATTHSDDTRPPAHTMPPAMSDAPTIRVNDSQRVDRLHRTMELRCGEPMDLLELTFDRIPRLRITLEGFEQHHEQDHARIHVELGGAIAGCGSLVKEVAVNQFLVPIATTDEHRCSILHFHGKGDVVNFLRVKLLRLSTSEQTAEVDVLHVCGQWSKPH